MTSRPLAADSKDWFHIESVLECSMHNLYVHTEAKVDVTQEIEQRAQQAAEAGADHCVLCSISCVQI